MNRDNGSGAVGDEFSINLGEGAGRWLRSLGQYAPGLQPAIEFVAVDRDAIQQYFVPEMNVQWDNLYPMLLGKRSRYVRRGIRDDGYIGLWRRGYSTEIRYG